MAYVNCMGILVLLEPYIGYIESEPKESYSTTHNSCQKYADLMSGSVTYLPHRSEVS